MPRSQLALAHGLDPGLVGAEVEVVDHNAHDRDEREEGRRAKRGLELRRRAQDLDVKEEPRAGRDHAARAALANSRVVLVGTDDEAAEAANAYASEHLIIQTRDPRGLATRVRHAGSIFLGPWTPEAAGDYAAAITALVSPLR